MSARALHSRRGSLPLIARLAAIGSLSVLAVSDLACAPAPESGAASAPAADALAPRAIRARTEREWSVKAAKMREHLLPLMRQHGVDLWTIISRENAPDPVVELFGENGVTK